MRFSRGVKFAAAALIVVLLLVFVPPLVSANRLEHRIAGSMSASLGRPVRLDGVSFHVLPTLGFTLHNLVVDEDPSFGYEPVIRADSVEASLRIGSLWRRRVEFSSVRFIQPSLNLVRNPEGRWNLENILVQASKAETAPTSQPKAGPEPRFPYIEATGGRVNLKLDQEKTPFSLTDADFALWLGTPEQWNVRLKATPIRTDDSVQNAGTLRLEGSLDRAGTAADVPLNLEAHWNEAPLGEFSRLLTTDDMGWRGTLSAEAKLEGKLGEAKLTTDLHLRDMRRTEFVPAHLMDVDLHCVAAAQMTRVTLGGVECTSPVDGAPPVTFAAATLDLQRPREAAVQAEIKAFPLTQLLRWLAVMSVRVKPDEPASGTVDGEVRWDGSETGHPKDVVWSGQLQMTLPDLPGAAPAPPKGEAPAEKSATQVLTWAVSTAPPSPAGAPVNPEHRDTPVLQLPSTPLRSGEDTVLTVGARISHAGYVATVNGSATPAQLRPALAVLPLLREDLEQQIPATAPPDQPLQLNATCRLLWGDRQTCGTAPAR